MSRIRAALLISAVALVCLPASAMAQSGTKKTNSAAEQLKDVNRSSQSAAGTKNPEAASGKARQNIDTPTKGAVRAGAPSTQSKAERDAAAIKAYKQQPAGTPQLREAAKKKTVVPSPGQTQASAPAAPVKPKTATAPAATKPANVAVAKPAPVKPAAQPKPAVVAAPVKPAPAKAAPVAASKPASSTFTTSSSSSTTSSSSASKPKR